MKHKNGFIIATVVLLITWGAPALASASVNVGESLQAAVDAAADGSLILVEPGTHRISNLTISGKGITLRSVGGPESTILLIDPLAAERDGLHGIGLEFTPHSGNQSTIEGFTLTYGAGYNGKGGGVACVGSSPTIKDNIIIPDIKQIYRDTGTIILNCSQAFFKYFG